MSTENTQVLRPGTMVDAYRIDEVIGSGGFGVTYRGLDSKLNQLVAIKEYFPGHLAVRSANDTQLSPRTVSDSEAYAYGLERFMREARTLAQFRNPNIVRVNRYVELNNTAYLVMDYEEGQPLSTLLERVGRVNDRQGYALAVHLLRGLGVIHGSDCLHRDIKPPNIFIRRSGPPLLLDFGAARFALEQRTGTLTVMYTPGYAPIEQYGGTEMQGPWSDLYATGATLYHAIVGVPPVASVERVSTLHAGHADPLLSGFAQIRQQVRPALALSIEQMLQPRAPDRQASAVTVLEMLQKTTRSAGNTTGSSTLPDVDATVMHTPVRRASEASPQRGMGAIGATGAPAPSVHTSGHSTGAGAHVPPIAEADLDALTALLAEHVGPIAGVLARRHAVQATSAIGLAESLADELDGERERQQFLGAAGRHLSAG